MLKLRDAFALAWTKLLSRKLWTGLFLAVEMILLAGVLIFTSAVGGFEQSLEAFNSEGLNGKYLVTASNVRNNPDLEKDPATWDLAEELYREGVAEHAAVAERLGLAYSVESEIAPTEYVDGKRELVAYSPYAKQAIDKMMEDYLVADRADLEEILQGYDYDRIFTQQQLVANGSVVNLEDGVENLRRYTVSAGNAEAQVFNGLFVLEEELHRDYVFEGVELDMEAIPVVISTEQAEDILGMDGVSGAASSEEKIRHFKDLREQTEGMVVEACYRNRASQEKIFQAQQILDEIDRNKDKPYYSEPSLIYNLPEVPCGATTVRKDTRTETERQREALQVEYQKAIGEYQEPVQKLMKFQIVGLVPVSEDSRQGNDILSMIQSLGGVSLATPLVSWGYYDAHETEMSEVYAEPDASLSYLGLDRQYMIEFNDAETARRFISEQSCQPRGALNYGCATEENRFLLSADNNNSLVIEDISRTFMRISMIIVLVMLVMTMIFVGLMVMRSITNDQKEIAIFRAIGFRRGHILQIYLAYALILAGIIAAGAIIIALGVGYALNPYVSGELASLLSATFFTTDTSITVNVFMPKLLDYLTLSGAVIVVPLVSALLATLVKSRQNIIDGLRVE